MPIMQTRRRFLTTASIVGGMSLLPPARALPTSAPLETINLRLTKLPGSAIPGSAISTGAGRGG